MNLLILSLVAFSGVLLLLIKRYFRSLFPYRRWVPIPGLPVVNLKNNDFTEAKKEFFDHLYEHLAYGRKHYRHTGFQVWTPEGYMVMTPEELSDEVKLSKDSVVDSYALTRSIIGDFGGYFWLNVQNEHFVNATRRNLISKLDIPATAERIRDALTRRLAQPQEWTPTNAYTMLSTTVADASARTFVGEELGRDAEWQEITLNYTAKVASAARAFRQMSYLGRWFAFVFGTCKPYREWRGYQRAAIKKLLPYIEARKAAMIAPDFKKPHDGIQWILDETSKHGIMSLDEQASQQMSFIFASIATTANTSLTVLYDLLAQPEYIEPLRAEVDQVLDSTGGRIDSAALVQLTKLDSFLKESQRLNGLNTITNFREVKAPNGITFSNGLHLPCGAVFAVPTYLINADPTYYPEPEKFQGFRHSEKRASDPENANRFFFTSTSPTQISFGHGRHSCPGRFFAAAELKTLLAVLLRNYDLKPLATRPRGPMFAGNTLADRTVEIYYRRRSSLNA